MRSAELRRWIHASKWSRVVSGVGEAAAGQTESEQCAESGEDEFGFHWLMVIWIWMMLPEAELVGSVEAVPFTNETEEVVRFVGVNCDG